jgi:uncharacterized protein YndB with AHSA1/START domain
MSGASLCSLLMARNRITIAATPSEVFETLSDPFAYSDWVVGTAEVVDSDNSWPDPHSRFSYRAGPFPFRWNGTTSVVLSEPDRRLVLRTVLPFGSVEIDIEMHPVDGGTDVSLTEVATDSPARLAFDVAFHFRNAETLARLKSLVEGGSKRIVHSEAMHALAPGAHWLEETDYAEVLDASELCYLAVATKTGPHVTPTVFTYSSGRIWILTPRASLKARRLSKGSAAGVLFRNGDRSVVVAGRATVLDPARLWIPSDLLERARAVPALGRYVVDQRELLGGFLGGSMSSLTDLNPIERVLVSIAPEGILLMEREEVLARRGGRPDLGGDLEDQDPTTHPGDPLVLDDVPDQISALADVGRIRAVLAVEAPWGPIAMPAHWHGERSLASVPTELLGGFTEGKVGLCLDSDDGADLESKEGMLVRGVGRVIGAQRGYSAIAIEQDKTTVWQGAETATIDHPD